MKTKKIKLKDITPCDYNPRKMGRDEKQILTRNLKEFGLVDPIIINLKNNHIIGGHQRYTALLEEYTDDLEMDLLELGDIGWVFLNTNLEIGGDSVEKALNISLNKISGEWDVEKLGLLFDEIRESGMDMDLTGFQTNELEWYDSDEDDIVFDPKLFDMDYVYPSPAPKVCPKCNHEFYP